MGDREAQIRAEIERLERLADAAEDARSWNAAVTAARQLSAVQSDLARLIDEREAEAITEPLDRVRRLLRMATEAGSYQAATALAKEEARIVEAARIVPQPDELADATPEELLELILSALAGMPDPIVVQIRDACTKQLGGPHLRAV